MLLKTNRYCIYCSNNGHTFYRRQIKYIQRRVVFKRKVHTKKKARPRPLHKPRLADTGSATQSPLCESCIYPQKQKNSTQYTEVTPELICDTILKLTEWREAVSFNAILYYIKENYPVTSNLAELKRRLHEQLFIAYKAGMVCVDSYGRWRLTTSLDRLRRVPYSLNSLTLFWELYCNTMDPLTLTYRKTQRKPEKKDDDSDKSPPSDN